MNQADFVTAALNNTTMHAVKNIQSMHLVLFQATGDNMSAGNISTDKN
jgi:hypothetical protein